MTYKCNLQTDYLKTALLNYISDGNINLIKSIVKTIEESGMEIQIVEKED